MTRNEKLDVIDQARGMTVIAFRKAVAAFENPDITFETCQAMMEVAGNAANVMRAFLADL